LPTRIAYLLLVMHFSVCIHGPYETQLARCFFAGPGPPKKGRGPARVGLPSVHCIPGPWFCQPFRQLRRGLRRLHGIYPTGIQFVEEKNHQVVEGLMAPPGTVAVNNGTRARLDMRAGYWYQAGVTPHIFYVPMLCYEWAFHSEWA